MALVQYINASPALYVTTDDWATYGIIATPGSLNDVVCADPADANKVVIGGDNGYLKYAFDTTIAASWADPAGDWNTLPIPPAASGPEIIHLQRVDSSGLLFGYAFGGVIVSTDFGATFNKINVPLTTARLTGHFIDINNGVIILDNAGSPEVYITADSGASWTPVPVPPSTIALAPTMGRVWMHSPTHFTVISDVNAGPSNIATTFDGGSSWNEHSALRLSFPYDVEFFDNSVGYVGGFRSGWYKTTDGGLTWTTLTEVAGTGENRYAIFIEDGSTLWRLRRSPTNDQIVEKSTDAGLSFTVVRTFGNQPVLFNLVGTVVPSVPPSGCTDPAACNYDPAAIVDNGCCVYDVTVSATHVDCPTCIGICYEFVDCEGNEDTFYSIEDFSAYVGQVVQLQNCPEICWIVNEVDCPDPLNSQSPVIIATHPDCVTCLPDPPPPPPLVIRNRTVKPGYDTPGCSPEFVDKVFCEFAEVMYQEMASVRYGIEFCCSKDKDKWLIKKQLLDLDMIKDPEACVPPPGQECCPPECVEAIMISGTPVACPAPTNPGAVLTIP